jgi:hypothetical protein
MKCNIIAQRIALQEYLIMKEPEISASIEALNQNEEDVKLLDRPRVEVMMDEWLAEFNLIQPSDYFVKHPTDDYELFCNIETEKEFMLSTLQLFGLPDLYIAGNGHFPDWGK